MASFGEGLGGVIGGVMADQDLQHAQSKVTDVANRATTAVDGIASGFDAKAEPYNTFGQSFLPAASSTIGEVKGKAGEALGYDQFMKGYTNTPAVQYQLQQADAVQNSSAAAREGLLSGANLRALTTINNGIVSQGANTAYDEYRAGNSQQFGQLETALGNMFQAIGIGQTATGQEAGVATSEMGANASIANAQSASTAKLGEARGKNDTAKGSGIGSMFSGLGSAMAMF